MGAKVDSLFRLGGPSKEDIDHFHDEGYIVYRDVLTDEAREKLIGEQPLGFSRCRPLPTRPLYTRGTWEGAVGVGDNRSQHRPISRGCDLP